MNESTQTLWFLAAAVGSVLLAVFSQPSDATFAVDQLVGKPLNRAFDPEVAKSLRILRFDEDSATLREFEVAEQDGVWSLPSKGGYPADAERQMAEATTGVMDLEILSIATQSADEHAEYGVVEPSSNLEVGQTGVGTRVVLSGADDSTLVDVVIGKEVKDTEDQHYVRRTSQDAVFIVGIDPESLSTTFEDWIENDLLGISPFDIELVRFKDYSAEVVQQGFRTAVAMDPRAEITLRYDRDDSKWVGEELREFDRDAGDYTPFELSEDQELNEDKLGDLKNALDDLRIVDVERKPDGLSEDLKAGDDFYENKDSVINLMRRGFAPTNTADGGTEVLSTEGEVIVTQDDGVEYVLRFGNLQIDSDEQAAPSESGEEAGDDEGVNRYLFVMARYNNSMIDPPELETVPEAITNDEAPEEQQQPTAEAVGEEAETSEGPGDEEPADRETSSEEADGTQAEEPSAEDLATEREAAIDRNQRAQDEYDQKVEESKARVKELNDRFGDWYYVIANDVYKKVALGRDELVVTKESEEDAEADSAEPANPLSGLPVIPDSLQTEAAAE